MRRSKNRYILVLLIAIVASFPACEKEIRLNLTDYTPKIVMNGIISPDSLIEIGVSKSFLYTDTLSNNSLLKNASLTLFINGEKREMMRMERVDTIYGRDRLDHPYLAMISVFRSTVRPKTGDKIRIEASAEGFNPVRAETTIPTPPVINRIDTATFFTSKKIINSNENNSYNPYDPDKYNNLRMEELYRNMRIRMAVTHNSPGENPCFTLQLRTIISEPASLSGTVENYLYIYTNDDPVFKENYRNNILEDLISEGTSFKGIKYPDLALFSDKLFRDNRYTLDFSITDYYPVQITYLEYGVDPGDAIYNPHDRSIIEVLNPPVEVLFTVLTPELYPYFKMRDYNPNTDVVGFTMFSEPGITFSNVHNGIGIVGAVSGTIARINIPPFPGKNRVPR
ncbi:DUF4249 family protein [uncultured Proteiniphilum sp.]|uniref:DUF4249 family protein n=1 Tax=uncultured Proteiniphilum sp. TaxID=497637 RepID=UPI00262F4861|nr:DUF4249 family protein [uncultured Proteiniphilum sp.]